MKFLDKKGQAHLSYARAVLSSIVNTITPRTRKPTMVTVEPEPEDDSFYEDTEVPQSVEEQPVYQMDEVFEPGVSAKIIMDKQKHVARIDFDTHQIFLEDKDGNVITTTRFDSRLENCPTKDLFNMIFQEVQNTTPIDPANG